MASSYHQIIKWFSSSCDGLTGVSSYNASAVKRYAQSIVSFVRNLGAHVDSPIKSASDGMRADAGFSLIELLVAVSILAFAAVTLLETQTQAIGISSGLERRSLASIVAENRLVLALGLKEAPVPGTRTGSDSQMGVMFNWRESVRPAPGGDLTIIHVVVSAENSDLELASLTGFRKGAK